MITTKRTRLRPISPTDSTAVFAYRSDAATNQYQGWIPTTLAEVDAFIAKQPQEFNVPNSWFQLVIIDRSTDQLIGDVGVHFIDAQGSRCEVGCTIRKVDHGKGFATEVLRGVIHYLFNELGKQSIEASVDPNNETSILLLERLGFTKKGFYEKSLFINGQWVDDVNYALTPTEFNT